MARIETFRELETWQVAMNLTIDCFNATTDFPPEERYGLSQQIRRSAVSIPSNLAEGFNRHSAAAYLNHVSIALGSQAELSTQLEIAFRVGLITQARWSKFEEQLNAAGRLLHGLKRGLTKSS